MGKRPNPVDPLDTEEKRKLQSTTNRPVLSQNMLVWVKRAKVDESLDASQVVIVLLMQNVSPFYNIILGFLVQEAQNLLILYLVVKKTKIKKNTFF